MASFIRTVRAPATPRSSAVTASPAVRADHHPAKALAHVRQAGGQRQDGHDLAGHGDVEAGVARMPFSSGPCPTVIRAQQAVVGVDHAPPGDALRDRCPAGQSATRSSGVNVVRVGFGRCPACAGGAASIGENARLPCLARRAKAVEQPRRVCVCFVEHARVDGRRHQVVGGRDGVDVAGQVQVEILHRDHLAVAAAGRAALDAEGRALAGLADAGDDLFPE